MTKIETSVHLMRLFSGDAPIIADYRWLEKNLGALVPMEVVCPHQSRGQQAEFSGNRMEWSKTFRNGSRVSAK